MRVCPICSTTIAEGQAPCRHEPSHADPLVGRVVAERYLVEAPLGAGGMGVVYRARQVALERTVALKVIRDAALGDPAAALRFRIEAQAIARLKHQHIVSIYDYGEEPGVGAYFVMEHLVGSSLQAELKRRGRLSLGEATR